MKQPTTEEIEAVIIKYADYLNGHKTMSREIYALIHPPRKPLSELHLDVEACRKVFEFMTPAKFINVKRMDVGEASHTSMIGQDDTGSTWMVSIFDDETFYIQKTDETVDVKGLFRICNLLSGLGYEPNTQP